MAAGRWWSAKLHVQGTNVCTGQHSCKAAIARWCWATQLALTYTCHPSHRPLSAPLRPCLTHCVITPLCLPACSLARPRHPSHHPCPCPCSSPAPGPAPCCGHLQGPRRRRGTACWLRKPTASQLLQCLKCRHVLADREACSGAAGVPPLAGACRLWHTAGGQANQQSAEAPQGHPEPEILNTK